MAVPVGAIVAGPHTNPAEEMMNLPGRMFGGQGPSSCGAVELPAARMHELSVNSLTSNAS